MTINKDRTGTDSCIIFAPQDDRYMGNKNLAVSLTAAIERMVDIKEMEFFEDFPGKISFEKADRGVRIIFSNEKKKEEILVKDYSPCSNRELDKTTLELISFLKTRSIDRPPAHVMLNIIKESIRVKNSKGGKYWKRAQKKYLCSADKLAAYIMFRTRLQNGVNISKYNRDSLNILLFYVRALSLTSGTGPVYEGNVSITGGMIVTPANTFLMACENEGRLYVKAEYADVSLPAEAKELADTILALALDTNEEIKASLDYHPCCTAKIAEWGMKGCVIEDWEIMADFSTWEAAEKTCKEKIRLLTGSSVSQLALPLFS